MSTQLTDFIQLIKKSSIARTNRFQIGFSIPSAVDILPISSSKLLSLTCLITEAPGYQEQTSTINYGSYDRKVVHGRSMGDFTTSFLVTGQYLEKRIFDAWHKAICDESQTAVNFYDNYVSNVYLQCLNENDDVVYQFELIEAYPISVSALRLDRTAQNQQMILDVTWAYFKIIDNDPTNFTGLTVSANREQAIPSNGPLSAVQRLLPIPGIDQMSAALQSAAAVGTEFRSQLQGVLAVANDVRSQVRDLKMSSVNGVKVLNGVVKDVKAINNIPNVIKNEVVGILTDTRNQIGYLKDDISNIAKYPKV